VPRSRRRGVEWLHRYDMRFLVGTLAARLGRQDARQPEPACGCATSRRGRSISPRSPRCSDVFFPRIWLRRAKQTPIGTVSR
jgi:hypothetical protein